MDNFQDAIHAFIPPHPDNDVENENMPELGSLDATGSQATAPQQETTADVEMNGEDSGVPPLASFSDSSDEEHDNNHDSESDREAHEVEMQTVNDQRLSDYTVPNPSSTSHTAQDQPAVNNRRARVEDDEDEDRDRRHPSQRIGNYANTASSAGPSSSTLVSPPSQPPTAAPQPMPGVRFRGQAPIFNRTVVDEATTSRAHPFRFFQHLMSNSNNTNDNDNGAGNTNPVIPSGGPMPAPQPHQDRNPQDNQLHGRQPTIVEGFSVTLDIGLGPAFHMGGGAQPPDGDPASNAAPPNLNANPNAQNGLPPNANFADLMARFGLIGQAMGLGENGAEGATAGTAPAGGNNSDQGAGGAGAQFGFNLPAGAFNLANLAGLGFGFNLDSSGFGEKEDPERARKLVDGLEEVPVGLVKRLERVGGTGGGMGEDETKGGDGGCAICWDKLLGSAEEEVHWHQENEQKEEESERTQSEASTDSEEASKPSTAKIVSLPCAHVFHAECLIPWFSRPRQTTCPTCRFNIDPENLTYVSWRRRMRERQERERAEATARGDPENADGNDSGQDGITPPAAAATAAEPAIPPLPDAPSVSEHVLDFLSSLESAPLAHVRSQTPDASALNVHPTPVTRSQSQPPPSIQATSSSSSSSSAPAPSTSHPTTQTNAPAQEAADDLDAMPGLQEISDSEDEEDNEEEEEEEDDEDQEEDEDEDERDGEQEQGNVHGTQAPPALPHEPPITSTSAAQAQAPRPRQNDPLRPRTIQTAHGLVTLIPVPFNFPFPPAANGVGVGVQAGGNAANANAQVPPSAGQGQPVNVNANPNTQALPQGHLYGPLFPHGLPFPHSHTQLPHMPEFGAQRRHQGATPAPPTAPAPANTAANNANAPAQVVPPAMSNIEERLIQHLLSQGLAANEAGGFRRSTATNGEADRLGRGGDPVDPEDEDEDDMMMDIDEGMGMVVDMTMEQGGILGVDGVGLDADPAAIAAQDEQDRQEYAQVLNFLNHAARHARGQAQTGTQTQGQTQEQERGTQGTAASASRVQSDVPPPPPQPQQPPHQQQGQGFAPFMAGLNAGFNIGNQSSNFEPGDGRTMNDFITQVFANLTGNPQQARQQAQAAQGQNAQPQPQPQPQPRPQAGQEPTEGPNPTNPNNNGGRPRQPFQFAFGNVTIGPFTNIGSLFDQIPMFNPNGAASADGQERVKKAWTLPPAPGPTLRQRIERRERDAGLRCYDISCGVGPSDEDPVISDETITGLRQLKIMSKNDLPDGKAEGVCKHTFHPGCLVSAERVASAGAVVSVVEGGDVEVSCPVCRSAGRVTKQEWDEGVLSLA